MRSALICGVSGQDGTYLTQLLLGKGYRVVGTSRNGDSNPFSNLCELGLREQVQIVSMDVCSLRDVMAIVGDIQPDEVYNLAGQSSVGLSFEQPLETFSSIAMGAVNVLEAVRRTNRRARLFNACSSECFGDTGTTLADEESPFCPASPYAVAKSAAFWATASYRQAFGLWACSGILFNHESPMRPNRFVTKKIVETAVRIARGTPERLRLGTLSVVRDWGWAPDYVDAMWQVLQGEAPRDYIIATGKPCSLEEFVRVSFEALGLDWREHVDIDPALARPTEPARVCGDPSRIAHDVGWVAKCTMPEVANRLIRAELQSRRRFAEHQP